MEVRLIYAQAEQWKNDDCLDLIENIYINKKLCLQVVCMYYILIMVAYSLV